jgi:competence protein ComEA
MLVASEDEHNSQGRRRVEDQEKQPKAHTKTPLLTRAEMTVIVVLSALLLVGVAALELRAVLQARDAITIDRAGRADTQYLIDLNTAGWEELALLPGVGETKAKAIIAYRERVGGFKAAKELAQVRGLGQKSVEKLLPLVTVLPAGRQTTEK